jgi:hypothetical protein
MHRTAQVVQQQIEEGIGTMEDPEGTPESAPSPFESPMPPAAPPPKPWRHKKRRWK